MVEVTVEEACTLSLTLSHDKKWERGQATLA
jgi:hypothetical protein